ncbi:hypothetical protein ABG775_21455 [Peribacillus simplex]|uniref:hypothetical protein n=1 Tax=Peribacillus TaxID=2675229 RepID=UPI00315D74D8
MNLLKKIALIVIASTILLGLSISSTFASASTYQGNDIKRTFEKMNDMASDTKEVKDSQRIQDIKNMSKDAISNEKVVLNNSNAKLDFDNARLLDTTQNNKNYTSITIPVVGDQYNFISNVTLIFDSKNKITNYSESLITKNEDNKFVITSYFDGELFESNVTDLDYKSNSELKEGLKNIQTEGMQTKGFKKIATCIAAVAGVDITVAYLIAGTCAASCPAVPPICAACIAAVATMGAGTIAGVIACFNL